ncbi:hypothetical protein RF11_07339 [Thelohanellus kitauei]|uniref:Uncharacterized protein n=1 Tax=Thelohanellus kitauei TaxID=669202 RepID=A0A0C2N058_THEKT|nr:hypothetical protein RF11_07339 [Thelohanellus kitauei]
MGSISSRDFGGLPLVLRLLEFHRELALFVAGKVHNPLRSFCSFCRCSNAFPSCILLVNIPDSRFLPRLEEKQRVAIRIACFYAWFLIFIEQSKIWHWLTCFS